MIYPVVLPPDVVGLVKLGVKRQHRFPVAVQPHEYDPDRGRLVFGAGGCTLYGEDLACPYGNPGAHLLFFAGNNASQPFHEAKMVRRYLQPVDAITDTELNLQGMLGEDAEEKRRNFFAEWDETYMETVHAALFSPLVWVVQW